MEKCLQKFLGVFDNFLESGKFCNSFLEMFGYIPIFQKTWKKFKRNFMGKVWKNTENMKKYFSNFQDKVGNNLEKF